MYSDDNAHPNTAIYLAPRSCLSEVFFLVHEPVNMCLCVTKQSWQLLLSYISASVQTI